MLTETLRSVARFWPGPVSRDDDLERALGFVGVNADDETVLRASYASAVTLALVAFGTATALSAGSILAVPVLALAIAVAYAGPSIPLLVARAKRTRALGTAPALVTRAALSIELSPSPERAAQFASDTTEGALSESLDGHVRRAAAGPRSGFQSFAREWRPWFPELERACALVESASCVPSNQRSATLDRARTAVLDAARDQMATFAASIRGPATAVYAFGVLLPLALVSLLPAFQAAGIPASLPFIAIVFDVALPLGLVTASAWLLARRPVAFPPVAVDRSHPDVPDDRWRGPLTGVVTGNLAWWIASASFPAWAAPVAATGVAIGSALVVRYRPATHVRDSVTAVESGLSDALALIGRRVERGESVEAALPDVAEELPGPTGDVLDEAARRQRRLGVGVAESFLGPEGALATVPSQRARGAARLLALAASEGRPAAKAVTAMGDHLEELTAVEKEARRSVEQVASTLSNTAAVFGPLVGGATVALAGAIGSTGPLTGSGTTGGLGLAVGGYVLVLAAVLTALSTGLSRGFDRSLVGYRVGVALLAATATYLASFVGAGLTV